MQPSLQSTQGSTDRELIRKKALELLESNPDGLQYTNLKTKIHESNSSFNLNTINGNIWNLDTVYPDEVYKPSRGLFRLLKHRPTDHEIPSEQLVDTASQNRIEEDRFYAPFSDWLVNEVEDATKAISLGGNAFKDKWGTPDVIGKQESRRSDIITGPTEIISAEIKTETQQLVTAFGQACAYKLFSHRVYLVVPRQSRPEEILRLDSLCQIVGIGLVTFNIDSSDTPDFRILVRPARHEPDLFYTNKYIKKIEEQLFP